MWQGENTWLHYVKNIMAADVASAVFLATFLRRNSLNMRYAAALEVADLQKYKLITKEKKVRSALLDRSNMPFVFFIGKN